MSVKILSVDDSKAVRIIVKKAFKVYDVDIVEATNGVEGLSAAAKETPDIILLDVTMPVMDGVEMLTKLKGDAALKNIPVIMLTAEAGRENVMKIAKLGIRDYIVKPFKEESLIEKVSRVIELQQKQEEGAKPKKNPGDGIDILVMEDKPAIIAQMQKGLAGNANWRIHGVANSMEAIDLVGRVTPDLAILSVAIPEDGAVSFFRFMRSNDQTKYVPAFGMAVKTAEEEIAKAQNSGLTQIITKPIDYRDLETKIVRALKLDTSGRYFQMNEVALIVNFPADCRQDDLNQIETYLKPKVAEAVDNGLGRIVINLSSLSGIDMKVITVVAATIQMCQSMGLAHGLVGNDIVEGECSGIEDATEWTFFRSIEEACA